MKFLLQRWIVFSIAGASSNVPLNVPKSLNFVQLVLHVSLAIYWSKNLAWKENITLKFFWRMQWEIRTTINKPVLMNVNKTGWFTGSCDANIHNFILVSYKLTAIIQLKPHYFMKLCLRKNLIKLRAKPLVQVYGIHSEFYVTHQQLNVGSNLTKLWYLVTIVSLIVFTVKSNHTVLFTKRAFNFLNLVEERNNSVMAFFSYIKLQIYQILHIMSTA